jgi:DNA-binding CsgD family transcriptional regulator
MTATATAEALARVDAEEERRWNFLRAQLRDGHTSAAIVHDGLGEFSPDVVHHDAAVEVEVVFTAAAGAEPSLTRLDLASAVRLAASGATIHELGAPRPRPPSFYAMASVRDCGRAALVRDLRGFGRMAMADEPFGKWYRNYAQHSGVDRVNERRMDAVRQLWDQHGEKEARIVLLNTVALAMADHTERYPPAHDWVIAGQWSPVLTPGPNIADAIVDALSVEAYGASRRHLPRARGWELRLSDEDAPAFRNDQAEDSGAQREKGVIREDEHPPIAAQVMSDWTVMQTSERPTEVTAIALVDGTITVGGALAAGLSAADLLRAWRRRGLTPRQAQVLLADQLGLTAQETGDALKLARSTVAATKAAAKRKLFRE